MKDIIDLIEEYGRACIYLKTRSDDYEVVGRRRPEQILNIIRAKLWARGCERREDGILRHRVDAILKRKAAKAAENVERIGAATGHGSGLSATSL